jgi:hypothetical protein
MNRAWSALPVLAFLLAPALVGSCAAPLEGGSFVTDDAHDDARADADVARPADEPAEPAELIDEPDPTPEREPVIPSGTFASVDALCRAQMAMVLPRLRAAEKELSERGEAVALVPRCQVSATALTGVPVQLRAPFLEVLAVEIETGDSTQTHLVTRTAAGWFALGRASVVEDHDDPGCFSIERDSGIVSVRVEGTTVPALVVVERSGRGVEQEEPAADADDASAVHLVTWDEVTHRARACRAEATGYVACDAPLVIRTEHVPSTTEGGRKAEVRFARELRVDATGHAHVD